MDKNTEFLSFVLPQGTLDYFDIIKTETIGDTLRVTLEEKNVPPIEDLEATFKQKRIVSKGFTNIRVDDFPIRENKVELLFRRRYWQVDGRKELLKRNIEICFPGTQLEKQFASFLKAIDGEESCAD